MLNDEKPLFDLFDKLGITSNTVEHIPVMTAADLDRTDPDQWEFPVKNFVLYDKKKQFYLVTVHLMTPPIDFRALSKQIGAKGSLSFGREEHLAQFLKVKPGSVTPFAIFNDTDQQLKFILDINLQKSKTISAHPMRNDKTTTINVSDFEKIYKHSGHIPLWEDIPLKS